MKLTNKIVLSIFLVVSPGISVAGLQHVSCSTLGLSIPAPTVESGPYFFSDRMILGVPLAEDPSIYFGDVPPLVRVEGGPFPEIAFRLVRKFSEVVWLNPKLDIRKVFEPGRLYTFVLMKDRLMIGRIPERREEIFSKHLVLANHKAVIFSGDIRMNTAGVLEFSNASGSYLPPEDRLFGFAKFLSARFGIERLAAFSMESDQTYHPLEVRLQERLKFQ